jgi:hypothetical protein
MYLSQDPIGLEGGSALYAYVHDPNRWVDGLGLNSTKLGTRIGATPGDGLENHHLITQEVWKNNQSMFDHLGLDKDDAFNGRKVAGSESTRVQLGDAVYHRGSHPQYSNHVASKVTQIRTKWKPGVNDDATIRRIRRLQRQLNAQIRDGNVPRSKTSCTKMG